MLAPHGLAFVSGWHSLNLLARSVEDEKRAIQPHLDLLKAMGCQVCIACETSNAIHGHDDRPLADGPELPPDDWAKFGADVEAIADFTAAQGLTLVYHHHMGTIVEAPHEIDHFMAATGPATKLLLDTGHASSAAATRPSWRAATCPGSATSTPRTCARAIAPQVEAEHLSFLEGVRRGVFTVPGDPEGARRLPARARGRRASTATPAGW